MLLYVCFRFSEVMDQMFLTVRGVVQGSFMAIFFGVNLDYLDFSGSIFDLFYEPVREKTNNLGSDQV